MALFLFALALHLFLAMGGTLAGIDFKLLIVVDEIGAILVAPVLFAMLLGLDLREAFLLRSAHWIHYVVAGATAIPLQMFGGAMQELVLDSIPGGDEWRELLERALEPLLHTETTGELILLLFGGVLLAAVCEEVLFRGLMLQLLARGRSWGVPIFITGLLFALFHLDIIGLLPRTLLGVYFGILVWRSGSVFPAMVAHGANNLLAFAAIPLLETADGQAPEFGDARLLALLSGAAFLAVLIAYVRLTPLANSGESVPDPLPQSAAIDQTDERPLDPS
ncbi:MAG TPA: CPBP family intramembrane glutamic endopeptidase [Acidobacteriota bacterium]|nr:CPBP family intramembrane glutamic endopeptidase [Acidobacteriota bacterium]